MTTPGTTAAIAASPALGADPGRDSGADVDAAGLEVQAVEVPAVDPDGPPLPTVAQYEDGDGRIHFASPFSKATAARVASGAWTEVDDSASPFDPTSKLVREVIAYLEEHAADQFEVDRVKAAEAAGEDRPTIRDWQPES